jgi:hypothetical protein
LVIALVVAPNLHFAMSLAVSPAAARLSIWACLLLYLIFISVPALRRVTNGASIIALVVALVLVALVNVLAKPVKRMAAAAIGFYDEQLPWLKAQPAQSTWTYRNPFGGYTLQIPQAWTQSSGPIAGTTELILRRGERTVMAARLRPSCDVSDEPMAVTVAQMLSEGQSVRRYCGHTQGLEACLLAREGAAASPKTPVRWEWLGRRNGTDTQIRLMFEIFDEDARGDALSIIASAKASSTPYNATACPNASEWAEPFSQ